MTSVVEDQGSIDPFRQDNVELERRVFQPPECHFDTTARMNDPGLEVLQRAGQRRDADLGEALCRRAHARDARQRVPGGMCAEGVGVAADSAFGKGFPGNDCEASGFCEADLTINGQ